MAREANGFRKRRAGAPADFFEAEAAGLAWLAEAEGGARCVRVLAVDADGIELERIEQTAPTASAARAFGAALARTHAAGADAFGAPPGGFTGQLYIGSRPMPSAHETVWGRFYARDRVLPFVPVAVRAGNLEPRAAEVVERACARIAAGGFDDGAPPARIHGDLWAGNLLFDERGAVLIDPAAHGGHRETDLAMLALFGAPFLPDILAGYEQTSPLAPGWQARVPLHQLHPLAVHAAGHGPSYGRTLLRAAEAVLALPE